VNGLDGKPIHVQCEWNRWEAFVTPPISMAALVVDTSCDDGLTPITMEDIMTEAAMKDAASDLEI
jgi:hypothetical protein